MTNAPVRIKCSSVYSPNHNPNAVPAELPIQIYTITPSSPACLLLGSFRCFVNADLDLLSSGGLLVRNGNMGLFVLIVNVLVIVRRRRGCLSQDLLVLLINQILLFLKHLETLLVRRRALGTVHLELDLVEQLLGDGTENCQLKRDDRAISFEGVDSLSVPELQNACMSRGIRTYGVSPGHLRDDMNTWLEMRLRHGIPSTLMVLSNAFIYAQGSEAQQGDSHYVDQLKRGKLPF